MIATATALKILESHADWWSLVGLGTAVGEEAIDWLAPSQTATAKTETAKKSEPVAAPRRSQPAAVDTAAPVAPPLAPPVAAPAVMPDDWDQFQSWLASSDNVPGVQWHRRRVLPTGRQNAGLMILSLTPELGDHDENALHSGDAGKLLDAMLRAIARTRGECYLASLALTRPPGGRLETSDLDALTPLLWHHLRIAQPQRLLLLGSDLARMVAASDITAARGQLLFINQDGVKVEAVAIQHPLLLLDRPARKAAAWDSLKRLAQG